MGFFSTVRGIGDWAVLPAASRRPGDEEEMRGKKEQKVKERGLNKKLD
jgi:hypothetical protein